MSLQFGYALDTPSARTFLHEHPAVYEGSVRSVNTGPLEPEVITFEWESNPAFANLHEVHPEVYFQCESLKHFLELQDDLSYHEGACA